ncbi:HAD family hydrolase [Pseudomonas sp. TH31]|uniref:HAD family hydrolase n=1 Tax=Pseudomonas sp. TH31 TaxID=2796396 RepID=UPI0019116FA7|nr:HAD family phosphatase [Pseudomonas sp. TH31]MBK5413473.1 HAD family phosphatase [Pseudomonas sp. TH31]
MAIRAVVFDFGVVLFDWNPHHLYRKLIADDLEREWFLNNICTQAWNTEQDAGRTLAEATRCLIAQHPEFETLIRAYYDRWHEMLQGPLSGGVEILLALHAARMPLFGLSNWSAETFPYARKHFPFLSCFRDIVVSGEVSQIKPDAAIYNTSFGQIRMHLPDIKPDQVVFIDDVLGNVEAAIALGWQGIHHVSLEHTRKCLTTLGVRGVAFTST